MDLWNTYHSDLPHFIREVSATNAMQRLRHVGMNCGCEYTNFPIFSSLEPYSRYDHSVGVGLIVWHFTRDVKQTVAALLHDISTPVFSHVVDFMRGDHLRQEATESETSAMIAAGDDLQECLRRLGLRTDDVDDYHRFPIADNDTPRLSADRLEYTLGNVVNYRAATRSTVTYWYDNLTKGINEEGSEELMFKNLDVAEQFGLASLRMSRIYVSDEDRYAMQMLAELIAKHIKRGVLTEADLYTTEPEVIALLANDPEASADWRQYRSYHLMTHAGALERTRRISAKKRYIDPYVQGLGRLSKLSPAYADSLSGFMDLDFNTPICGE